MALGNQMLQPVLSGTQSALAVGTEDEVYTITKAQLLENWSDPDGEDLSVTGLTASRGTVAANPDGSYTISQIADANGLITLNYSVSDGTTAPVPAIRTFTLAAVNDAPSFNGVGTGLVLTPVGTGTSNDFARSVTVQADGKIIVAGQGSGSGGNDFAVVRYNPDGSLDATFGTGGKVLTPVSTGTSNDFGQSVTVQADGKILVSGRGESSTGGYDFAVVRYNADGSLDTGFGTGGTGKVLTPIGAGTSTDVGYSVTVQADGKIVVAGQGAGSTTDVDFAVVRYNADGSLDTGFGSGGTGKVLTPIGAGTSTDVGYSVTVQADGKIVVAGYGGGGGSDFAVVRYNADGSLDTGFGTDGTGKILTPVSAGTSNDFGQSVTVQADGKIVVAGYGSGSGGIDFAVVRYNADGTLDTGFGPDGTGKILTPISAGTSTDYGYSVTVQADGKIVVAGQGSGSGGNDFAVVRYNADGSLDTGFGPDGTGKILTPISTGTSTDVGQSVTVQADGKIVVAGFGQGSGSGYDFAVVRYNADGSLDTTFNLQSSLGGTVAFTENGSFVRLDTDVTLSDPDLDALHGGLGDYAGATLTLARQGGADASDAFGFDAQVFTVSGNDLRDTNGAVFATFTDTAGTLTVTFTGTEVATSALADAVARAVTYANTSDTPPSAVTLAWTFSDGNVGAQGPDGAATTTGTTTVTITPVNDAPLLTGSPATLVAGTEDTAFTVTEAQLLQGFADPEGTALVLSGLSVDHGTIVSDGAGGYTVTPAADYNGPIVISYSVGDGSASIPATLSTVIAPVNEAPSFNGVGTGKVLTPVGTGTSNDMARSVVVQADGKIVVAGIGQGSDGPPDFALVRYNTDGSLDTSFGPNGTGKILTPVGNTSNDQGYSVTLQADGKIVVAGQGTSSGTSDDFAVVRYNADGSLDTSFGTAGTGKILTPVGTGTSNDTGTSVTVQADGKVLVAGYGNGSGGTDFAVVRYNTDGTLDTGFGTAGKVLTPVSTGTTSDFAYSVTVQANGKILLTGYGMGSGTSNDIALVRYNTDGSLDTGFGTGGKILTPVGTGTSNDVGQSVTVQADGRILVAGYGQGSGTSFDVALVRYNVDGSLDTSFGTGGKILTPVGTGTSLDAGTSVTVQADGKIVVAGYGTGTGGQDFAMVRYNTDGSLDTNFGPDGTGKITTPVSTGTAGDAGQSVTVQADGKIVVVGYGAGNGTSNDFAVVRYNADGSLDTTFNAPSTLGGTVAFTENGSFVRLDTDVTLSDPDLDALHGGLGDYAGATLTLARQGGADASDAFGFDAQGFTVSGNDLRDTNGAVFATFTDTAGTLTVTFTGTEVATSDLADAVARAVTYANTSDTPPSAVTLAWTFSDGNVGAQGPDGAATATGTTTVTITPVNDAPLLTGSPATLLAGTEDTAFTVTAAQLLQGFADPEGTALVLSGLSVDHGTIVSDGAGGYTVTPAADYNGPIVISYSVGDGSASIPATLSTTLEAANDAPRLTGTQATLLAGTEDTAFTVTEAQLLQGFADPEGTALVLSGLSVDHGTIVSDGAGGYTVTPAADYNGPIVISYSVEDGSASIPATLSTTLEAANDAPRLTGTQATLLAGTEDTAFTVTAAELLQGFVDPEGTALVLSGLSVDHGTIVSDGTGGYTVTPDANYSGQITISYSVGDGTTSIPATLSTTLATVNDAPSFFGAGTGKVLIPVGADGSTDLGRSVTVQADGKIVVAGYGSGSGGIDFAVVRYNADGSLDTGFGPDGTGKILTPVSAGTSTDQGYSVTVQADGKIVVAGYGFGSGTGQDFALVRYNADGSLDTGFGPDGTGKILTPVGTGTSSDIAYSVTVQADGKIVVAGYGVGSGTGQDFAVVRYTVDGSLDTSFGPDGTGKILTPVGTGTSGDLAYSVTVQSDGKIVVMGYGDGSETALDFAVARYNANGTLDTSFGSGGKILTPVGADGSLDRALSGRVQSDGKIIVVGYGEGGGTGYDFAVVRYNADGSLDTSFGSGGKILTPISTGSSTDIANSVTVQADGKIVVAGQGQGSGGNDFAVVRYNANGSLDTTFGPDGTGKIVTPVAAGMGADVAYSVTIQADGKIVVAGTSQGTDTGSDFAVVRYNADGSLDTTFNLQSSLGGTVAFTENGSFVRLDSDVTLSDAELYALHGGLGDYAGATLTLARQGGAEASDTFGFDAQGFTVSGNSLLDTNGAAFATFTDTAGTLTVTFTGTEVATSALADAVARAVTYANTSDTPASSVTLAWTLSDGNAGAQGPDGAATTTGTTTVTITPVNDAPLLTGTQATLVAGREDAAYTGRLSDLLKGFTDTDSATLAVTNLRADHGTVTITGGTFTLTPDADYHGPVTLSYDVGDGTDVTAATRALTLASVNDAPAVTDDTIEVVQRSSVVSGVLGNDIDTDGGTLTITAIRAVTAGTARTDVDGATVIAGRYGTLTLQGNGSYTYEANAEGRVAVGASVVDDFLYTLSDGQGAAGSAHLRVTVTGSNQGDPGNNIFLLTGPGTRASGYDGDDTYIVDDAGDRVVEATGGGIDTVKTSVSYTLAAGQEIETLRTTSEAGTTAINLTGNAFDNKLVGNDGDNVLNGGEGADQLYGSAGDDTYIVDYAGDRVVEAADGGTDTVKTSVTYTLAAGQEIETLRTTNAAGTVAIKLTGNAFDNKLVGNDGDNVLNGGEGADQLYGGAGNDTYIVDEAGDRVFEAADGGTDTVRTSVTYTLAAGQEIETLRTTSDAGTVAIKLTGNAFDNKLVGNDGDNVLNGGGGADQLYGSAGDDTYIIDEAGDRAFEATGGGADSVKTSVTYRLAAGQEIETLRTTSDASTVAINLTGNEFDNKLVGNDGDNVLNGGEGADQLYGSAGDDTYIVDYAGDRVVEAADGGTDTVKTSVSYTLLAGQEVETLRTTSGVGMASIDLTGNALANKLVGNDGDNVLNGGAGADVIYGRDGSDTFVFSSNLDSANVDRLVDFSVPEDTIQLARAVFGALATGQLAEAAFKDLGNAGAVVDASDRILYDHKTGALSYDADGNGTASTAVQFAVIGTKETLTYLDFLVA